MHQQNNIELELAKWQRDTVYTGTLPGKFFEWVAKAMPYTSPYQLRMSVEDYVKMRTCDTETLSILDVNTLFYVVKMRTQNELAMDDAEYIDMQQEVEKCAMELLVSIHKKNAEMQAEASKNKVLDIKKAKVKKNMRVPMPSTSGQA